MGSASRSSEWHEKQVGKEWSGSSEQRRLVIMQKQGQHGQKGKGRYKDRSTCDLESRFRCYCLERCISVPTEGEGKEGMVSSAWEKKRWRTEQKPADLRLAFDLSCRY